MVMITKVQQGTQAHGTNEMEVFMPRMPDIKNGTQNEMR